MISSTMDSTRTKKVSYNFLRSEIPIRLAGLILEFDMLPGVLQKQVLLVNVRDSLLQTFNELVAFESNPTDSDLVRFDETLVNIRARHADLVRFDETLVNIRA